MTRGGACMVKVLGPDPKSMKVRNRAFFHREAGKTVLSCSGWAITGDDRDVDDDVVLTSAWLVAPFIRENNPPSPESPEDQSRDFELLNNVRLEYSAQIPSRRNREQVEDGEDDDEGDHNAWFEAELVTIIQNTREVREAFGMLRTVLFGPNAGTSDGVVRGVNLCGVAVLRRVRSSSTGGPRRERRSGLAPSDVALRYVRPPDRGLPLLVTSSAYGLVSPSIFRNSITRGVVSNVLMADPLVSGTGRVRRSREEVDDDEEDDDDGVRLIFTDARCGPGSEGAPATDERGRLVGLVVPIPPSDGSQPPTSSASSASLFELGVVLPVKIFWKHLVATGLVPSKPTVWRAPRNSFATHPARVAVESVVMIRNGFSWGTGVVVNSRSGLVVTCAHVVAKPLASAPEKKDGRRHSEVVLVSLRNDVRGTTFSCEARVLYCADRERTAYDVALLQCASPLPGWVKAVPTRDRREHHRVDGDFYPPLREGEEVYSVGFALLEPDAVRAGPTVCCGCLAKHIRVSDFSARRESMMIQTSARVFRGHSGGLLCDSQGRFLGVLTSNARHIDRRIIPEINFSLPATLVLRELVSSSASSEGGAGAPSLSHNNKFETPDERFMTLWNLDDVDFDHQERQRAVEAERKNDHTAPGSSFLNFMDKFERSKL